MPKKPNYNFEKRQKEIARKQKKEEKLARKREERTDERAESQPVALPQVATE
jgi:hypothetical protein